MTRRSILDVTRAIVTVLRKEEHLSIKGIADRIGSQWETTVKVLDFLKEVGVVTEKKGKQSYKAERLFRLNRT